MLAIGVSAMLPADSLALSLGRSRGTPLIGKPLDVSVMGTLESAQESTNAQCFEADVFYGDTRLPSGSVRISVDKAVAGNDIFIRVRSTQAVDEPVVTIFLKATCLQLSTRRYVLLSEASTEELSATSLAPAPTPRAVAAATAPLVAPPVLAANPNAAGAQPNLPKSSAVADPNAPLGPRAQRRLLREQAREERRVAAEQARVSKQIVSSTQTIVSSPDEPNSKPRARASVPTKKRATEKSLTAKANGARLELDSADFFVGERSPNLRPSSELLTPLATDPQQRLAAAALWKSLQSDASDALQASNRLTALESELAAMRGDGKRQQAALQALSADLVTARSERYINGFSMTLLAIALLALAGLAYAWAHLKRKASPGSPWWARREAVDSQQVTVKPAKLRAESERKSASGMGFTQDSTNDAMNLMTSLDASDKWEAMDSAGSIGIIDNPRGLAEAKARLNQDMKDADALPISSPDFSASLPGVPRTVNAEELFDIQQQAEFFVSLGQHTQAIDILRNHIREHPETSAMAYLDLFEIYYTLKLTHNYETLRAEFNSAFNGNIPAFEQYNQVGRGLEYYPRALTRIQLLWPSERVLDVIEESVFRKHSETAKDEGAQSGFDLLAYRELLMLHAIIKDVHVPEKQSTARIPPARGNARRAALQTGPQRTLDEPSSDFGITDLDQLPNFEQSMQSMSSSLIDVMSPQNSSVGFNDFGGALDFESIDMPGVQLMEDMLAPSNSGRLGLDINLESIDSSALVVDDMAIDFDIDDAQPLSKKPSIKAS